MSELSEETLEEYLREEEEKKRRVLSSMLDSADDLTSSIARKALEIASTFRVYPAVRNVTIFGPSLSGSRVSARDLYVLLTVDSYILGRKPRRKLVEEIKRVGRAGEGLKREYIFDKEVIPISQLRPRIKLLLAQPKEKLLREAKAYRSRAYLSKPLQELGPLMIASGVNLEDKDGISIQVQKELVRKFPTFSDFKLEVKDFEEYLREREVKRPYPPLGERQLVKQGAYT